MALIQNRFTRFQWCFEYESQSTVIEKLIGNSFLMALIYDMEGGKRTVTRQRYKEERGIWWFKMAETQGNELLMEMPQ